MSNTRGSTTNSKEDSDDVGNFYLGYNELSEDNLEFMKNSAINALRQLIRGEKNHYSDVAETIKSDLESRAEENGTWHVIVGKSFGSFVSHESNNIVHFMFGSVSFLIFKHG